MILTVALATPLRRLFDYLPPEKQMLADNTTATEFVPGMRVKVPFGARTVTGMLVGIKDSSDQPGHKLKAVQAVIDKSPLVSGPLLELYLWAAGYYQHPVGDALFSSLPSLLRKGETVPDFMTEHWKLSSKGLGLGECSLQRAKKQQALVQLLRNRGAVSTGEIISLGFSRLILHNLADKELIERVMLASGEKDPSPLLASPPLALRGEQQHAVDNIRLDEFCPTVLFGDTGTGKTEVYLQAIAKVLQSGRQALVLVPEINLTPQTLKRFRQRFNCSIKALHSGLTDRERLQAWAEARAGLASIIIGTRSAVFTPMANPGIIILDEEHDPSFKQQEGFRYSARDVAVMRASRAGIPVVLGSATPSLETLNNCHHGRYQLLQLKDRGQSHQPAWQLVDLKGTELKAGLAAPSIEAIKRHLSHNNQVLIFLNRRGYAPIMLCHDCGWQAQCRQCTAKLTAHLHSHKLICHHCEWQQPLPHLCPQCGSNKLQFSGQGTERCEETLKDLFPGTTVIRIDRDSTRKKGAMERAITDIKTRKPCILLGTQMLAKGHHFPDVSLAVLLDVDGGLFSTDFRAIERTAQMIVQVAGRAGRGEAAGEVYLQSHYCDHPLITNLLRGDYRQFAGNILQERKLYQLPPYTHLALFRADALEPRQCEQFLQRVRLLAEGLMPPSEGVGYLGPLPGTIEKRRNQYRYTLLINGVNRRQLAQGLTQLCVAIEEEPGSRQVKWSLDVDPMEMS